MRERKRRCVAGMVVATLLSASPAAARQAIATQATELRAGPGSGHGTVGRLVANGGVDVLLTTNEWAFVRTRNQAGWVPRSALALSGGVAATSVRTRTGVAPAPTRTPAEGVHDAPTHDAIPLHASRPDGGPDDAAGSVRMPASTAEGAMPSIDFPRRWRTLHLRSAPTFEVRLNGRIPPGGSYEVLRSERGWTQVVSADGVIGWVRSAALAPARPSVPAALTAALLSTSAPELGPQGFGLRAPDQTGSGTTTLP